MRTWARRGIKSGSGLLGARVHVQFFGGAAGNRGRRSSMDAICALISSSSGGGQSDLRALESQLREQEDAIRSLLRGARHDFAPPPPGARAPRPLTSHALQPVVTTRFAGNNCQAMATALAQLRPSQHSLGLLYLLSAQSHVLADGEHAIFFGQLKAWLLECDGAQIRLVPKMFAALCKKCLSLAMPLGNRSVMAVRRGLLAAIPRPPPTHARALRLIARDDGSGGCVCAARSHRRSDR